MPGVHMKNKLQIYNYWLQFACDAIRVGKSTHRRIAIFSRFAASPLRFSAW